MAFIDDLNRLLNLFSIILLLTAAIMIFRQHKAEASLLVMGVIAKYTPAVILVYLLVPDNVYLSLKFKLVNLLQPVGAMMIATAVLMLVWRLQKREEGQGPSS